MVVALGREHGRLARVHRLVLLLVLHAPVLEPDLDLALAQGQVVGDLDAPAPGEVLVEVELLLQLQGLVPRVGLPGPLAARTRLGLLHPGVDLALRVGLLHARFRLGARSGGPYRVLPISSPRLSTGRCGCDVSQETLRPSRPLSCRCLIRLLSDRSWRLSNRLVVALSLEFFLPLALSLALELVASVTWEPGNLRSSVIALSRRLSISCCLDLSPAMVLRSWALPSVRPSVCLFGWLAG